jgi:hypothetical protein
MPEGVAAFPFARDGIGVIVHPSNRIAGLTLNQVRSIYRGEVLDWQAVGGPAGEMDRNDGSRLAGHSRGDRARVEVEAGRIDVGEHGSCAGMHDAIGRGTEGQRRRDDLIARTDAGCQQRQVEAGRARIDGNGVLGAEAPRKRLFEALDPAPGRQPSGLNGRNDLGNLRVADVRRRERHLVTRQA